MSDLISRQDSANEIREYITEPNISDDESEIKGYNDGIELAISVLSTMPSAEPVRHGKWKCTYSPNGFLLEQTCSECGLTFEEPSGVDYNYCPQCGADMRGESDD